VWIIFSVDVFIVYFHRRCEIFYTFCAHYIFSIPKQTYGNTEHDGIRGPDSRESLRSTEHAISRTFLARERTLTLSRSLVGCVIGWLLKTHARTHAHDAAWQYKAIIIRLCTRTADELQISVHLHCFDNLYLLTRRRQLAIAHSISFYIEIFPLLLFADCCFSISFQLNEREATERLKLFIS